MDQRSRNVCARRRLDTGERRDELGEKSPAMPMLPTQPLRPAESRPAHRRQPLSLTLLPLVAVVFAVAGCATPASVPDRSASTQPEAALDRGFSSPGTAPTAPGETR